MLVDVTLLNNHVFYPFSPIGRPDQDKLFFNVSITNFFISEIGYN